MNDLIKKCTSITLSLIGIVFTIIPESVFEYCKLFPNLSNAKNIIINRTTVIVIVFITSIVFYKLYLIFRKSITIKGRNYCIKIKYGDIFKMKNSQKIIPFDECFTTKVGYNPAEIKPDSICGQYLNANPIQDVQVLINSIQLKPARSKSQYNNMIRYDSGRLVPNGDYLFLAFAKLNKDGKGQISRAEYVECLSLLWQEIDKYYVQKDVCIPILGSGITHMEDSSLTQQELLDIIIESYKLSIHKIKYPNKLYIVCKKCEGFSLDKIGGNI